MKKTFGTFHFVNQGEDPINVGDMIGFCPCCEQAHTTHSDCKQGVRP